MAEPDHSSRDRHLFGPGPKRILSLDGGGVRGVIAVAFLERIEAVLSEQRGDGPARRLVRPDRRHLHRRDHRMRTRASARQPTNCATSITSWRRRRSSARGFACRCCRRNSTSPGCGARSPGSSAIGRSTRPICAPAMPWWRSAWTPAACGSSRTIRARPIGRAPPEKNFIGNRHYPLANLCARAPPRRPISSPS